MAGERKLARIFKALSVDTRVRIVNLLRDRALCVGALSARLDVTQGAVSQHLRVLRDADLVVPEKRGYYVHYRLSEKTLAKWRHAVERFLGKGGDPKASNGLGNSRKKGENRCVKTRGAVRSQRN